MISLLGIFLLLAAVCAEERMEVIHIPSDKSAYFTIQARFLPIKNTLDISLVTYVEKGANSTDMGWVAVGFGGYVNLSNFKFGHERYPNSHVLS
jgi:hypothetical protein